MKYKYYLRDTTSPRKLEKNFLDILWTGSFLYAPYSFLLISIKFWMGGRGRVVEQCGNVTLPHWRSEGGGGLGAVRLCYSYFTEFSGPQMALANWLDAISKGPKNSRFPGPNPLPLALVLYLHASKT